MWPRKSGGRSIIRASHSQTRSSSSVGAGPVRQSMALTFRAAASVSPRMPGPEPVMEK